MVKNNQKTSQKGSEDIQSTPNLNDTPNAQQPANDELAAAKESLLRLQAEFANYQRRTEEDMTRIRNDGKADVLRTFIEAVDDFELALKHAKEDSEFKKGMEMVFAKLVSSAEAHGLNRIETIGVPFNPHDHEALLTESSDKPEQTILEELQAGYKLGEQVIRTAKVKVAKK